MVRGVRPALGGLALLALAALAEGEDGSTAWDGAGAPTAKGDHNLLQMPATSPLAARGQKEDSNAKSLWRNSDDEDESMVARRQKVIGSLEAALKVLQGQDNGPTNSGAASRSLPSLPTLGGTDESGAEAAPVATAASAGDKGVRTGPG